MSNQVAERSRLIQVRSALLRAARDFFDKQAWPEVTTSLLTSMTGSCENVEHLFRLPYFGTEAHLSQTSQLQLEHIIIPTQEPAWTITHSFRAEEEVDKRHLTEFVLIEPEVIGFRLDDIINLQQDLIMHFAKRLLKEIPDLIDKKAAANLITPFRRISYKDAIQVLVTLGLETSYGDDISSQHERALLEWNSGQPLFITHFPKHGRLAHRSLTALRRRYANKPELHEPDWARAPVPRQERALLLAGRWNNDNANDRTVLSALAGKRAVTRR